jgi:hypothetical protein
LEEARTEQFLPAFFERNYKTIKFIYRGLGVIIPILAGRELRLLREEYHLDEKENNSSR